MQLDKRILEGKKPLGVFDLEEAKELISLEDFQESMRGITGTVCQETIDEAPMVYKDSKEIERQLEETVEITNHLKVLGNFKGF